MNKCEKLYENLVFWSSKEWRQVYRKADILILTVIYLFSKQCFCVCIGKRYSTLRNVTLKHSTQRENSRATSQVKHKFGSDLSLFSLSVALEESEGGENYGHGSKERKKLTFVQYQINPFYQILRKMSFFSKVLTELA